MAADDDSAVGEIYAGDFDRFTKRRDELAQRLRADGDRDGADRVKALKKPSRPAWAVNQVSARRPELRDRLLEAGAALRDAQQRLIDGKAERSELRAAGEDEQTAVAAALDAAYALTEEDDARLSATATERVRQTLHAVALDEEVRADFERHRLVADHEASGLAGLSLAAAVVEGGPARKPKSKSKSRDSAKERRELKAAETELRRLERSEEEAEREVERAHKAAERAQRDLEHATEALEQAAAAAAAKREEVEALRG